MAAAVSLQSHGVRRRRRAAMACLMAAWSVLNPSETNAILMVSSAVSGQPVAAAERF